MKACKEQQMEKGSMPYRAAVTDWGAECYGKL